MDGLSRDSTGTHAAGSGSQLLANQVGREVRGGYALLLLSVLPVMNVSSFLRRKKEGDIEHVEAG